MAKKSNEGTFDARFRQAAQWFLDRGVKPNHFTFAQIPVFALEIWAALNGHPWLFVSLILFVMMLDGGDGILARVGGLQSKTGAVLDASFDTVGILIVLWGAGIFEPEAAPWLMGLFAANTIIYLQNIVIGEKAVTYVRGPILTGVAWPPVMLFALICCAIIAAWLLLFRLPRTLSRLTPSPRLA